MWPDSFLQPGCEVSCSFLSAHRVWGCLSFIQQLLLYYTVHVGMALCTSGFVLGEAMRFYGYTQRLKSALVVAVAKSLDSAPTLDGAYAELRTVIVQVLFDC